MLTYQDVYKAFIEAYYRTLPKGTGCTIAVVALSEISPLAVIQLELWSPATTLSHRWVTVVSGDNFESLATSIQNAIREQLHQIGC